LYAEELRGRPVSPIDRPKERQKVINIVLISSVPVAVDTGVGG
jgi:hypothetical protein